MHKWCVESWDIPEPWPLLEGPSLGKAMVTSGWTMSIVMEANSQLGCARTGGGIMRIAFTPRMRQLFAVTDQ